MARPNILLRDAPLYLCVDPPYPDETNSSVLDRAAAFHRVPRNELLAQLVPDRPWWGHQPDVDYGIWYDDVHHALIQVLGMSSESAAGLFCPAPMDRLRPCARSAYCPLCFMQDLRAGRTPFFRWQWSHAFVTLCHVHGAPLCDWRRLNNQQRVLPRIWTVEPRGQDASACEWLQLDVEFALNSLAELKRYHFPLQLVHELQEKAFLLNNGPEACDRNRSTISRTRLGMAIQAGAAWRLGHEEPIASTCRPPVGPVGLFGAVPKGDWRRQWKSTYRGFYSQRSVAWRRTVMWFAADILAGLRCGPMRVFLQLTANEQHDGFNFDLNMNLQ